MSSARPRVAVLGATGAVGAEILQLLGERRLPLASLRLFASEASEGAEIEFGGEVFEAETIEPGCLDDRDLVFAAAPGVLGPLLPEIEAQDTLLVDLSGALELDPEVPLWIPGRRLQRSRVAIPRGVVGGLAIALSPLAGEAAPERVTVTTLESASGAGRRGLEELREQTVGVLSAMDGSSGEAGVFPQSLAFDCLPAIGEFGEGGETFEERRLRHVLRRVLGLPHLEVEITRVRVPVFMGGVASVHVRLAKSLGIARLEDLWRAAPALGLLSDPELPTPRAAAASDLVQIGRVRIDESVGLVAFVLALDLLRRGAALGAVEAAEQLLAR